MAMLLEMVLAQALALALVVVVVFVLSLPLVWTLDPPQMTSMKHLSAGPAIAMFPFNANGKAI